jgi:nitrite reductase/ring-hydroxylating ferredoxin subunit
MSWVALCLSDDLEPGTSTGAIVAERECVLWRDTAGKAHVWEDRCPHRGMRLSFGFVRGDRIACLYHGWRYDTAGQCRAVPAHPDLDVPKTIRVRTYPMQEACGLIWANLSGEDVVPPSIDAGEVTPVRSLTIDRPLDAVSAALTGSPLPGFAEVSVPMRVTELGSGIWRIDCGRDRLVVAGQAVSPDRTSLHIVILGAPNAYAGAGQSHFARWAEALRDDLERVEAVE